MAIQIIIYTFVFFITACIDNNAKKENSREKEYRKIIFDYKKLHQKPTLKYKKVDSAFVFKNKFQRFSTENYETSFRDCELLFNIIFHENSKIFYTKPYSEKIIYPDLVKSYFLINQEKVFLDNINALTEGLLQDKIQNNRRSPSWYVLDKCYNFEIKKKNFLACFGRVVLENSTNLSRFIFLFDITKKNPKLILSDKQESFNMDCFGDWDEDGNLDYFHKTYRMQKTKKLHVQSLKNDIWVKDTAKYIYLEGTFFDQIINVDKSKWYFDLKEK